MKKILTIIALALSASLVIAQKSITFVVDEDLPAPKTTIPAYDDQWVAQKIVGAAGIPEELQRVVKTSFEGERIGYMATDNFFKCFVQAYADHRPLELSPDVVWLIISQGFSRYVNAHTDEMRDLLVFHEGKKDLVVNSNNDVLSPSGDWELLLNDFSACIAENTKSELADLMIADFTTTGITERIASQISLMDVVKEYFNFLNVAISCGIPSITLKGSPGDWQKVLDKARGLRKYNLKKWAGDLEVILEEFVKASEGRPNKEFWQGIVKKRRVDQLQADRGCLPNLEKNTKLDGWFLKFFPNEDGETSDSVLWNSSMPEEMVRVPFKHILIHPVTGEVAKTISMELWAGFVGVEENAKTHALSPKIGWLARIADPQAEEPARQKAENQGLKGIEDIEVKEWKGGLPIPQREVVNAPKKISMAEFEELSFVETEGFKIAEEEGGVSNENNPRIHINLTDEEQTLVIPVNDLGFNMFRKVGSNESILLSPLGMTYALGLINNGAAGKTRTQINKVLGCDDMGADNINGFCRKMLTKAPGIDKLTTLEITNEFFSHKSNKLKSAFKEVAIDNYNTKFKDLESNLMNVFALVNTIYFKGVWTDKFRKANTRDEVFIGEDGKEQTVPMMNQMRQFFYTENDLWQALCLPYSNGAYQMIVMLPKEGKTVQEVAQSLTADSWEKCYDQMRRVTVDVKLPRFESSSEVNLTGVISALGMPNAFSMGKADFRNLFDLKSCISKVTQIGRIKVDETGTEASVVTALQGRIAGLDLVQPDMVRFYATHPFLYFIREWSTGAIFFMGQYMGTPN